MLREGIGKVGREVTRWEEGILVPESEDPSLERVDETLDSGRKGAGWNGGFWSLFKSNKSEELLLGKVSGESVFLDS